MALKKMTAEEAAEMMIERHPIVKFIHSVVKPKEEYIGCHCDLCKKQLVMNEGVYQDTDRDVTICTACYDPTADYSIVEPTNRIIMACDGI